eukprot:11163330-Prorocentrum_lima.AAC.1
MEELSHGSSLRVHNCRFTSRRSTKSGTWNRTPGRPKIRSILQVAQSEGADHVQAMFCAAE